MKLRMTVNGTPYDVDVEVEDETPAPPGPIVIGGTGATPTAPTSASVQGTSANAIVAPLAGSVARILVEVGQEIQAGQVVVVLEAMKMETEITSPGAGQVAAILVSKGDAVQGGQALVEMV